VIYLYPNQIIHLYKKIIEQSGGSFGLRDKGLLESAVYRPQASFGGHELYTDLFSKAAALGYSLIKNHPFVDGNKRVGYIAMRLFLRLNGTDLNANTSQKLDSIMGISKGKLNEEKMTEWLKKNSSPLTK
jgi:death-on-curing protein